MEMKFDVVYTIKEGDTWRSDNSIKIESNMANDKLISCEVAKSLVEHLKKESATLEPDKLLLGFAEAQRRGIQDNFKILEDMELIAKNRADKIQEKIIKSYEDCEEKYGELEKKFTEIQNKFCDKLSSTRSSIKEEIEYLDRLSTKLLNIDNYSLDRLSETLKNIISLVETDSDIVKLVLKEKNK